MISRDLTNMGGGGDGQHWSAPGGLHQHAGACLDSHFKTKGRDITCLHWENQLRVTKGSTIIL